MDQAPMTWRLIGCPVCSKTLVPKHKENGNTTIGVFQGHWRTNFNPVACTRALSFAASSSMPKPEKSYIMKLLGNPAAA